MVAGLVVIGVGGYFVYRGFSRSFQKILRPQENPAMRRIVNVFGTVGYTAKGLVLVAVACCSSSRRSNTTRRMPPGSTEP